MELFKESLLGIWDGVRGHGMRKMKNNVEEEGVCGGVRGNVRSPGEGKNGNKILCEERL